MVLLPRTLEHGDLAQGVHGRSMTIQNTIQEGTAKHTRHD